MVMCKPAKLWLPVLLVHRFDSFILRKTVVLADMAVCIRLQIEVRRFESSVQLNTTLFLGEGFRKRLLVLWQRGFYALA